MANALKQSFKNAGTFARNLFQSKTKESLDFVIQKAVGAKETTARGVERFGQALEDPALIPEKHQQVINAILHSPDIGPQFIESFKQAPVSLTARLLGLMPKEYTLYALGGINVDKMKSDPMAMEHTFGDKWREKTRVKLSLEEEEALTRSYINTRFTKESLAKVSVSDLQKDTNLLKKAFGSQWEEKQKATLNFYDREHLSLAYINNLPQDNPIRKQKENLDTFFTNVSTFRRRHPSLYGTTRLLAKLQYKLLDPQFLTRMSFVQVTLWHTDMLPKFFLEYKAKMLAAKYLNAFALATGIYTLRADGKIEFTPKYKLKKYLKNVVWSGVKGATKKLFSPLTNKIREKIALPLKKGIRRLATNITSKLAKKALGKLLLALGKKLAFLIAKLGTALTGIGAVVIALAPLLKKVGKILGLGLFALLVWLAHFGLPVLLGFLGGAILGIIVALALGLTLGPALLVIGGLAVASAVVAYFVTKFVSGLSANLAALASSVSSFFNGMFGAASFSIGTVATTVVAVTLATSFAFVAFFSSFFSSLFTPPQSIPQTYAYWVCGIEDPNLTSETLKDLFINAGTSYGVPAPIIASISLIEFSATWQLSDDKVQEYSQPGAKYPESCNEKKEEIKDPDTGEITETKIWNGPMQLLTTEWEKYKNAVTDSTGESRTPEICNIKDSIYAAAKKIKNDSGIDPSLDGCFIWEQAEVIKAAEAYFGQCEEDGVNYCDQVWQYYLTNASKLETNLPPGAGAPSSWPVGNPFISGYRFHSPIFHNGTDVATYQSDRTVFSPFSEPATVYRVSSSLGGGNAIEITSGPYWVYMGHLASLPSFSANQVIPGNAPVGTMGHTGIWQDGDHVHFEIKENGGYINPESILPTIPARSIW